MTSQFFTQDALEVIIFPVVFPFIPSPMNIPRFRWFGEVFLIVPRTRSPGDLLYDFHAQGRSRVQQANGTHPSKGTQETPGHKSRIQVIQVIRVARNIPTVHDSDSLHLTEATCILSMFTVCIRNVFSMGVLKIKSVHSPLLLASSHVGGSWGGGSSSAPFILDQ